MEPRRILVVANQTACGQELLDAVRARMAKGAATFTLVVPATHASDQLVWTDGAARAIAERRLAAALEQFRAIGAEVDGVVGDANPVLAVGDVLLDRAYDEIILSTLPSRVSRWLKMDLPRRLEQRHGLPLTTVIGERAEISSGGSR